MSYNPKIYDLNPNSSFTGEQYVEPKYVSLSDLIEKKPKNKGFFPTIRRERSGGRTRRHKGKTTRRHKRKMRSTRRRKSHSRRSKK